MARPSKSYSKHEKQEGRNFEIIFYPTGDSGADQRFLNSMIASDYWDEVHYIYHDKDIWSQDEIDDAIIGGADPENFPPAGTLKKAHYHILCGRSSQKSKILLGNAVSNHMAGFPFPNLVNVKHNWKKSVQYLIHQNHKDKFQYQSKDIVSNNFDALFKYLHVDISTVDKALILHEYITSPGRHFLSDLFLHACSRDCYDELRRGQHLYLELLKEHNFLIEDA